MQLQKTKNDNSTLSSDLNGEFEAIFKKASKTYFYSSLFFPGKVREQINTLYAFVRTADDFVDSIPADPCGFLAFKNYYLQNSKIVDKTLEKNSENLENSSNYELKKNQDLPKNIHENQNQNGQNQTNSTIQNSDKIAKSGIQTFTNSKQTLEKNPQNNSKTDLENLGKLEINVENSQTNSQTNSEISKILQSSKNLENLEENQNLKLGKNSSKLQLWQKIVLAFVDLEAKLEFEKDWTLAFLQAMESDLSPQIYPTIEETGKYIYGSAGVIGLFMARILDLPKESYYFARHLGQSFQYINFIRDIAEDLELGRCYFPQNLLESCNLRSLKYEETSQKPREFHEFMRICIKQYEEWQEIAENGFKFFPKKYKIAIKTASDMYKWTGKIIAKDPFIVYQKKIKPQKRQVLFTGILNWIKS